MRAYTKNKALSDAVPPRPCAQWQPINACYEFPRVSTGAGKTLEVTDRDSLPLASMIEVRHTSALYRYYRRDEAMWTKVGESRDPFLVEIEALSHAGGSVMLREVTDLF